MVWAVEVAREVVLVVEVREVEDGVGVVDRIGLVEATMM